MKIAKKMCLFLATFLLLVCSANAANLVSVIIADTTDDSIGDSVAVDFDNMRNQTYQIAKHTGLELKEVTLKGDAMTAKNMLSKIKNLKINRDDVVLFYFSGHGYRTDSKGISPWPNLYFSIENEGVEYEKVAMMIESKRPRLFVMLSDVCNSFIPDEYAPVLVRRAAVRANLDKRIQDNYRRLFLETDGVIKITSSMSGEYSFGTDIGGLFSVAFIKSLDAAVRSSVEADWRDILDRAAASVEEDQHPVYVID